jgi:hypothetical protein
MFHNLRANMARARFYKHTSGILETPPMPVQPAPWSIVSMVSKTDVQMYVLALKAFYSRIGGGTPIAIIDRDMPSESRAVLEHHFPGIKFEILEDIPTGPCQRGGTWERILYVLDRSSSEYTIQLDCDTLTVGDVSEVVHCVRNNIPFTLGNQGLPIWTLPETAANARGLLQSKDYIGIFAESRFDQYPDAASLHYVRGSSGFAGFSRGGFNRAAIEAFHVNMERLIGSRWREWGTEQNASNFAIANSPGAIVLPFPKYTNFTPDTDWSVSSLFHFFGTYRYSGDYFAQRARTVIDTLNTSKPRH